MISQFKENHLLSSPFTSKSLVFLKNALLSPCNTRINVYSLDKNHVEVLPFRSQYDIKYLAAAVDGSQLVFVDEQDNIVLATQDSIIGQKKSKFKVNALQFSPDGKMWAIARGNQLIVYKDLEQVIKYQNKHQSKITGLSWSPDSRFILTWGQDNSIILNSVFKLRLYEDVTFQAHKFPIVQAFFFQQGIILSIDELGKLCVWRWVSDYVSEGYKIHQKIQKQKKGRNIGKQEQPKEDYTEQEMEYMSEFECKAHLGRYVLAHKQNLKELLKNFAKIRSAETKNNLLMIGQYNGVIQLLRFEQNDYSLEQLQTFQITNVQIDTMHFNEDASWIGLGMRQTGQLIVWEWRSQSYILNQQQLSYETVSVSQSQNLIATGSISGTIRLWDKNSYLCIAKFSSESDKTDMQSHQSKVTSMIMHQEKNVLLSCSVDGTIRAFDCKRLKCFRVMQPEIPNQLQCLAFDGDLVCAGGFDPYEIYCFSLQSGQLVEVVAGHRGPVTQLLFTQFEENILLISASWDKSVRIHDLYSRQSREGAGGDVFEHNSEITALCVKEDGTQIVTATMKGELLIWDTKETQIVGTLDVDRDIQGGRASYELLSSQNNTNKKHFTTMVYVGGYLLGGGNSKFICMYDMRFRVLIKKFIITNNLSLEGINLKVDFNKVQKENELEQQLPGAKSYDVTKRSSKKVHVAVTKIEFSQSKKEFIVCHSEGVSVFGPQAYKKIQLFDPLMIDENVTVEQIQQYMKQDKQTQALIDALRLDQDEITSQVFNAITDIEKVTKGIPEVLVPRLIGYVNKSTKQDKTIESNLLWAKWILLSSKLSSQSLNALKELQRTLRATFSKVEDAAQRCIHQIDYLLLQ